MRDFPGRTAVLTALCLLTTLTARPAAAQTAANGSITGKVVDAQGAVLPGVTVTAAGAAVKGSRTSQSDPAGAYRFADLPPGEYTVSAELMGFVKAERKAVAVEAGRTATVDLAVSASEAASMAASASYDLIVLDCCSPESSNLELGQHIRRQSGLKSRTPIVAITSNSLPTDRTSCLAAGFDDTLSKPFQPEALASILARWVKSRSNED